MLPIGLLAGMHALSTANISAFYFSRLLYSGRFAGATKNFGITGSVTAAAQHCSLVTELKVQKAEFLSKTEWCRNRSIQEQR
ncbi:MAG: hypothetical protein LUQ38_03575 [Methanotrichaceae archaeon]|nr:hypothetical protein [Methanotrichaceae archaeon]